MAPRRALSLSLLAFLIAISFSSAASSRVLPLGTSTPDKVRLGVYCEAMCPFCSMFYSQYLDQLMNDDELLSIVDLYIAPWGQTQILKSGKWDCVHGPYECFLNTVEACALNVWPKLEDHFPFISCVEGIVYESLHRRKPIEEWKSCFQKLSLDPKPILDCTTNGTGVELELQYAEKTSALQPPIEWVPWIVVDGKPVDYVDYIKHICEAYKGSNPPKACSKFSLYSTNRISKGYSPVCYKTTPMSTIFNIDALY